VINEKIEQTKEEPCEKEFSPISRARQDVTEMGVCTNQYRSRLIGSYNNWPSETNKTEVKASTPYSHIHYREWRNVNNIIFRIGQGVLLVVSL
jgi:hypothetical protein